MEKFRKLNREEMKNVTGGYIKYCIVDCKDDLTGLHAYMTVSECSADAEMACYAGGMPQSCTCTNL